MEKSRRIKKFFQSKPTLEGAGVHLKRAFGFNELPLFDPFLLLDDFRSDNPAHYLKGFPWHPHRGIETITYVLEGKVEHGDSMGNTGGIISGDVQWMTAGSGIVHQEMPKGDSKGRMEGFQLWANLPAAQKMMPPRYQNIQSHQIPTVKLDNGVEIKIIIGQIDNIRGPVTDIVIEPEYLDITLPKHTPFTHATIPGHKVFAYVIAGRASFCPEEHPVPYPTETLLLFEDGDHVSVKTGEEPARFLLCSGKPINEPVAWRGPIVMNTQAELELAFEEYHQGTFIKNG